MRCMNYDVLSGYNVVGACCKICILQQAPERMKICHSHNPTGAHITAGVVVGGEAGDFDVAAAGVDELAATDVNAHVRGRSVGVVGPLKEDQVTGLQVGVADGIAVFQLICSGAGRWSSRRPP